MVSLSFLFNIWLWLVSSCGGVADVGDLVEIGLPAIGVLTNLQAVETGALGSERLHAVYQLRLNQWDAEVADP